MSDLSAQLGFPFNLGVLFAVNAIRDAALVLDGPGCAFYRAMVLHGRHDWTSSLLSCEGRHRLQYTGVSANSIAADGERLIREALRAVAAWQESGAVLLSSLPMCTLAGTDYARLLREEARDKPAALVPGSSLSGDWLDGYDAALAALAENAELAGRAPAKDRVALIGYFMDRGEGDHRANLAELARLLGGLGLECAAIWPSGGSYAELLKARRAGLVVSLPYGRRAARVLAARLGAPLVETGLPFGLEGTAAWLRQVAQAAGRARAAERLIGAELSGAARRLQWAVPYALLHARAAFAGDPHLAEAFCGLCDELGLTLALSLPTGGKRGAPRLSAARAALAGAGPLDLFIGNTDALELLAPDCARMEFGFPSLWTHCLGEEPFLGFAGCLAFVDRMLRALLGARSRAGAPSAEVAR